MGEEEMIMFGFNHYIPILKWKSAEIRALRDLNIEDRKHITPLIELVLPKASSPYKDKDRTIKKSQKELSAEAVVKFRSKKRHEVPNEILNSWGRQPIFIDFSLLKDGQNSVRLKVETMNKIVPMSADLHLNLIPVINLDDESDIKQTASLLSKKYYSGLCLRIPLVNLEEPENLNEIIEGFLSTFRITESEIDLLVDMKSINNEDARYPRCISQGQKIRNLPRWRNIILASGAFPEDLQGCNFGEDTLIPRSDWKYWLKYVYNKRLARAFTFADYTIRNPLYKEATQFYPPTTSIRYTIENDWIVMKGKRQKFEYYLANAKLLVEASGHYFGRGYSAGDLYVDEKAHYYPKYMEDRKLNPKVKGTGGSEDWIYAGINHHLALTARQVSNLS